jgi:hypothetical protein
MKIPELCSPDIPDSTATKICNNIAIAIEANIFLNNNELINNAYKKKFRTLYLNLIDYRNSELRFSILNSDITPQELVKMSSEELAPSSLKSRRMERQNKYFQEQVLMKEEAKIIAKTHKGESILTVNQDQPDLEQYITPDALEQQNTKENKKEKFSDKASWDYPSDNEERKNIFERGDSQLTNKTLTIQRDNSSILENSGKSIAAVSNFPSINKKNKKEIKYKNLSEEQVQFHNMLEEYTRENLFHKLNEKLKIQLKPSTVDEIIKMR